MAASSMRRQGSGLESSRRSLVGRIQQRKSCSGILIAGGLAPSGETITAYISRWPHTSHQPLIPLTNQNEDDPGVPPATAEAYMTACKTGVPPQGLGMADATQTMDMDLASALTTANHTATTGFPCNSDWTQGGTARLDVTFLGKHSGHSSTRSSVRSTAPLTITEAVLQLNTACGSPDLVGIGEGDSICTLIDRPTMTGSKPVITSSGEECTSFTLALKCSFLDLGTAVRRITHTHALMDVLTPAGEGVVAGTGAPSISHLGSGGNPNANHCLRCTIHGSQAALATLGLTDAPLHISAQGIFNAAAAAAIGGAAGPRPNMSPPSPLASHDSGLPQEPNTSSAVANPPSPPTSACPTPSNGEGEAVAGESSAHKRQRTAESPPPPGSANITMDVDADSAVADWLTKLVHASSADNISSLCVHTAAGPNGFSICIDGNNTDFAETLLRRSKSGLIPPIEVGIEFGREKVSVRLSPPSVTNHHRRYAIVVTGVSAANRTSPQAAQFVIKQLADLAGDGVKRIHDLVAQWAPVADKDDLAALSVALSYFGANTKDILRLYSVVLGSNVSLKQAESDATISLSVMTDGHGHAFSLMPSGYTTISSSVLVYCNTALTVALLTLGAQYRLTHNDGSTPALRAYMKQGHLAVSIWAGLNNSDTMPDLSYSEASARVSAQLFISLANGSSVAETAEAMAKLGDGPVPAAIIEQAVHSMATLLSAAPQALSDTTPPPEPVSAARVGPSSRTNSLTNRTASGNSRGRASDGTEATSRSNPGRGEGNRGASSRGGGSYNHGRTISPTGGRTSGRESGRGRGRGSGSQF